MKYDKQCQLKFGFVVFEHIILYLLWIKVYDRPLVSCATVISWGSQKTRQISPVETTMYLIIHEILLPIGIARRVVMEYIT